MSDDFLRIIPTDQNYIPDSELQQRALGLLKTMLPDADEHEATVHDELSFIDQGVNCEAALCPSCGARVRTDGDDGGWWWDLTEEILDRSVAEVRITMLCCAADIPFPSLRFDWPAGFAHFELWIQNPRHDGGLLTSEELKKLQDVLSCELMQIRAHY